MRQLIMIVSSTALLAACTTPTYVLQNPETKQIEIVGGSATGSMTGGAIGYHIQKENDEEKIERLKKLGFVVKEIKSD